MTADALSVRGSLRASSAQLRTRLQAVTAIDLARFDLNRRLQDEGLLKSAAMQLGIRAPWNAPRKIWSWAWKLQCVFLPILHFFDSCATRDMCLNLAVLWWKSISGDRFSYDLLPSFSRIIVSWPFRMLYPLLHHQNVALRTEFLDTHLFDALTKARNRRGQAEEETEDTAVVTLGAGFDSRSLRFATKTKASFFELDLPQVVEQKSKMLDRFMHRRRKEQNDSDSDSSLPRLRPPALLPADLNDVESVKRQLSEEIFTEGKAFGSVIVMVEAVLMYLDSKKVAAMLQSVLELAQQHSKENVTFIFSDRFPRVYEKTMESLDVKLTFDDMGMVSKVATEGGLESLVKEIAQKGANGNKAVTSNTDRAESAEMLGGIWKEEERQTQRFLSSVHPDLHMTTWLPKPGRARHQGVAVLPGKGKAVDDVDRDDREEREVKDEREERAIENNAGEKAMQEKGTQTQRETQTQKETQRETSRTTIGRDRSYAISRRYW